MVFSCFQLDIRVVNNFLHHLSSQFPSLLVSQHLTSSSSHSTRSQVQVSVLLLLFQNSRKTVAINNNIIIFIILYPTISHSSLLLFFFGLVCFHYIVKLLKLIKFIVNSYNGNFIFPHPFLPVSVYCCQCVLLERSNFFHWIT